MTVYLILRCAWVTVGVSCLASIPLAAMKLLEGVITGFNHSLPLFTDARVTFYAFISWFFDMRWNFLDL